MTIMIYFDKASGEIEDWENGRPATAARLDARHAPPRSAVCMPIYRHLKRRNEIF